ncbi:MAG: hypothetical protein AB8G05_21430 [Oligoflexales bacterium]
MRELIILLLLSLLEVPLFALNLNPNEIGLCECFEEKDYNRKLVLDFEHEINYPVSKSKLLKGKAYAGFKVYKGKEFAEDFFYHDKLTSSGTFKTGILTVLQGVFAIDKRPDFFSTPEFHLEKDFIERIGRKLTILGAGKEFGIEANKWIKHKIPMLPQINIKMKIKVASYQYAEQKWSGHADAIVPAEEIEILNDQLVDQLPGLVPLYTISSATKGLNGNLNGTRFFSTVFKLEGTDKQVLSTWQFVSLDLNWMVKKVLYLNPQLLKKTMYRDYSRFVDAVRLVGIHPYGSFH